MPGRRQAGADLRGVHPFLSVEYHIAIVENESEQRVRNPRPGDPLCRASVSMASMNEDMMTPEERRTNISQAQHTTQVEPGAPQYGEHPAVVAVCIMCTRLAAR